MILLVLGVLMLGRPWQAALWVLVAVFISTAVTAVVAYPAMPPDQVVMLAMQNIIVGSVLGAAAFALKKAWLNRGRKKRAVRFDDPE